MMHIVQVRSVNTRRKMYLPSERIQVHDFDGNLGGFFDFLKKIKIGKAVKRATTFTKTSFRGKNIFGAIGSVGVNLATAGMASAISPKTFSAHSKIMQKTGMGFSAAALAAGTVFTGGAAAGLWAPAFGAMLSGVGSGVLGIGGKLLAGGKLLTGILPSLTGSKSSAGAGFQPGYVDPYAGLTTAGGIAQGNLTTEQMLAAGLNPLAGTLTVSNESLPGYGKKQMIAGVDDEMLVGGLTIVALGIAVTYYVKSKRR